jgi:TNF receptor-associated factor 5
MSDDIWGDDDKPPPYVCDDDKPTPYVWDEKRNPSPLPEWVESLLVSMPPPLPKFVETSLGFMCLRCDKVLNDPHITGCGHTTCRECVLDNCPECRHPTPFSIPNLAVAHLLPERHVICFHCTSKMTVGTFDDHLSNCDKRPKSCPHGCGRKYLIHEMDFHMSTCGYATTKCPDCKHQCPRNQLEQHRTSCGGSWIQCSRCVVDLKRRNLAKHTTRCVFVERRLTNT